MIRVAASLRTISSRGAISNVKVKASVDGAAGTVQVLTLERGRGLTGTKPICRSRSAMSALRGKADVGACPHDVCSLTQSGHSRVISPAVFTA